MMIARFRQPLRLLAMLLLCSVPAGLYSGGNTSPAKLGLNRAQMDDRGLLELTINLIEQGLASGDVTTLQPFLSPEVRQSDFVTQKKLSQVKESDSFASSKQSTLPNLGITNSTIIFDGSDRASVTATLTRHDFISKTNYSLNFRKINNQWKLVRATELAHVSEMAQAGSPTTGHETAEFELYRDPGANGATLSRRAISDEHKIAILTRSVTKEQLERQLFSKPYAATLFSSVTQLEKAPFLSAQYVLMVTDPAWNRIIYGDYDGWIKEYGQTVAGPEELNRPHGIDRDVSGTVYVADTGNDRVVVLRLKGNGAGTQLQYQFDFGSGQLNLPYDVAWDDSGTPFTDSDDLLWVADTGNDRIVAYAIKNEAAAVRYIYGNTGKSVGMFARPQAIAVGRFNGISNGQLYVADSGNRRVVRLLVTPGRVKWQGAYDGQEESQFTSLDVDHWGNVYASDRSYREVCKLNSALAPITRVRGTENSLVSPVNFSVTFGRVHVEAENRDYWTGYDQALSLGQWSETSGAERFQLGLELDDFAVNLSQELDRVSLAATVTDQAKLTLKIIDAESNVTVRQIPVGWVIPGAKSLDWDRRDDSGWPIAPDYYRLQLTAESSYGNTTVIRETPELYLPLYYHEDSGSDRYHDSHLVQGTRNTDWGTAPSQSSAKHPSEVIYRFSNLNPTAEYEIKAQFNNEVGYLKQRITVDDHMVDEMILPDGLNQVEWKMLPRETYSDGDITIRIAKIAGEDDAFISQLWLREADYDPASPPVLQESAIVPTDYSLSQNYPNPFNPSTTIRFDVPGEVSDNVILKIFNTLGQTIKTLVDEPLPAGSHSVVWDGRDSVNRPIATGVYFYQLRAGDFIEVRKMALTK